MGPELLALLALLHAPASAPAQDGAAPAPRLHTATPLPGVVSVKLRDGLRVRVEDGRLVDDGTGDLDGSRAALETLGGGRWSNEHRVDRATLARLRRNAEERLARPLPDPALELRLELPSGLSIEAALERLRDVEAVERALAIPAPLPTPGASAPNLVPFQTHLVAGPTGLGSLAAFALPGGTGAGVSILDVEFSFDASHLDLPAVTLVGPPPNDPFDDERHGTAVLGILGALPNAFGTIGAAPGAQLLFAAANTGPGAGTYSPGAAITQALTVLGPGDVLLVEQQIMGPDPALGSGCGPGDPLSNLPGAVPIEWHAPWYDAIVLAVGNGVVVVEAAGNGQVDLDDPAFAVGHAPFLPQNDSGAILVGAGHPPGSSDAARSRTCFSNHGSTLDLQAFGGAVVTTGYGDAYSGGGEDLYYTGVFNGTSSASALVAALCAQVQGVALATTGAPLAPDQVLAVLASGAQPQTDGTFPSSQRIGPQPDLAAALVPDCDGDGVPDAIEIVRGDATDVDGNGVPDDCLPPPLYGAPLEVALSTGGTQVLALRAGSERAGQVFFLLGSLSGTQPGTVDPTSGVEVPLVLDAYLLLFLGGGGAGVVSPAFGLLDAGGEASATVTVPPGTAASFAGLVAHHAFVVVDPLAARLTFASNALPLALVP